MVRIQTEILFDQNIFFTFKTWTNTEGITHGCENSFLNILSLKNHKTHLW